MQPLAELLPPALRTSEVLTLLQVFEPTLDALKDDIDAMPALWHADAAPEPWLDVMLADLGQPFALTFTEVEKRRLVRLLVHLYRLKGTAAAIESAGRLFFGLGLVEVVPWQFDFARLGQSRIEVDFRLGSAESAALYSFAVRVDRVLTARERERFGEVIRYLKPCHTHFVAWLQPGNDSVETLWRLGRADLGERTVLA